MTKGRSRGAKRDSGRRAPLAIGRSPGAFPDEARLRLIGRAPSPSLSWSVPDSAPAPVAIRRLAPTDLAAFRALMHVFGEVFDAHDEYATRQPDDAYLRALLSRETFFALVAEDGGEVVGGLAAYVFDKFEQARREVYLYDLGVVATHRRRGIASALIADARAVAAALGAYVVIVQADTEAEDAPAIALYSRYATPATVMTFDLPVPPDP